MEPERSTRVVRFNRLHCVLSLGAVSASEAVVLTVDFPVIMFGGMAATHSSCFAMPTRGWTSPHQKPWPLLPLVSHKTQAESQRHVLYCKSPSGIRVSEFGWVPRWNACSGSLGSRAHEGASELGWVKCMKAVATHSAAQTGGNLWDGGEHEYGSMGQGERYDIMRQRWERNITTWCQLGDDGQHSVLFKLSLVGWA